MILLKIRTSQGVENHRVSDFPCKIGRALDNDIVIDDQSVSFHHAVIDTEGAGLFMRDLKSTNGLIVKNKPQETVSLKNPVEVRLGEVNVGIRSSGEPIQHTVNVNVRDLKLNYFSENHSVAITMVTLVLSFGLFFILRKFMNPVFKMSGFVGVEISVVLYYAVLGALLSIWSKFQTTKYNYMQIVFVIAMSTIIYRFYLAVADFIDFNVDSEIVTTVGDILFTAVVAYYFLNGIAKVIFPYTLQKKRVVVICTMLISIAALLYGFKEVAEERVDFLRMPLAVGYPLRSFSESKHNFDNLQKEIDELNGDIEKQRLELLKKEND